LNDFKDARVLVTGGAGFIGSHLVDRLMNEGAYVRVLDDFSDADDSNIECWKGEKRFELVTGDVRNADAVSESLEDITYVFHNAAKVSIPLSAEQPHYVLDVNVMGTSNLLDQCRKTDVEKIVFPSSASVYGDVTDLPVVETAQTNPISPYGVSKLMGEQVALTYYHAYGLKTAILRLFNVYGPRQTGGSYSGVISIFLKQAMENQPLTIDGDGQQTRDFVFVDDVVAGNLSAAVSKKSGGRIYNIGSGSQVSIDDLADVIIAACGSSSVKSNGPPRAGDIPHSSASIEQARKDTGFEPKVTLEAGIGKTLSWIREICD
jgi:UDP-glucose 4-epimerase